MGLNHLDPLFLRKTVLASSIRPFLQFLDYLHKGQGAGRCRSLIVLQGNKTGLLDVVRAENWEQLLDILSEKLFVVAVVFIQKESRGYAAYAFIFLAFGGVGTLVF